jgi:hypothetical protein
MASACRSASKRASTALESIPLLDDLDRHRPFDRLGLLGHEDAAHAARTDLLDQLVLAGEDGADAGSRIAVVRRSRLAVRQLNSRPSDDRQRRGIVGPE